MKRIAALVLVALCGLLWAAPPASATPVGDGCHGYVKNFYKESGRVYVHYTVRCNVAEDTILVQGMVRQGDRIDEGRIICHNTSFCTAVASLSDPAGSQRYYASTYDTEYTGTSVVDGGKGIRCNYTMTCTGAGKDF